MRLVVLAALALAFLIACASERGEPIESDEQLSGEVLQLDERGKGGRLAGLTSFEWGTVYTYYEGASSEDIARDVGSELKMNDYYDSAGCLLVFLNDGEDVRAITAPELIGWDGENRFGADVELVPGRLGKPSGLPLVDPGADPERRS